MIRRNIVLEILPISPLILEGVKGAEFGLKGPASKHSDVS